MRSKLFFLFILLSFPKLLSAQTYEKAFEAYFAWEVKQVDEFIERFNDDEYSYIRVYLKKTGSPMALNREKMIKSLFNTKGTNWNYQEINEFIKQVDNPEKPQYLDFNGQNWFAKVKCKVTYAGQLTSAVLTLKIEHLPTGAAKWVVTDIKFPESFAPLLSKNGENLVGDYPEPLDPKVSLNPMSHAIDFMNIDLVTKDPKNIKNFVADSIQRSNNLNLFIDACVKNKLKILKTSSITYNFLQIKGWSIEIKQFNRQTLNSGWLISKLTKRP